MKLCPCSSGKPFDECCGPILAGTPAPTAEALMRSRYTAYAEGDVDYLRESLHPDKRRRFDPKAAERWSASCEWTGLEIVEVVGGGEGDERGEVEFVARFSHQGAPQEMPERGLFVREDGKWYYVQGLPRTAGQAPRAPKVGRNEPCPCGSGQKYKKCCGR
ncbi:SEC-C motif domain protein [Desulfovibrio sp. X2]|uniref:YchJ family protein n=1 Tax=Desulfovibrio sp. X2 TaxID=941449 RepID=UPI000358E32C|nr:YchJ family protein [Desulfovibrio sp. X2]EPR38682.1 SEC-C motif domain protein [Desulfovibrio sp. X2]